MTIADLVSAVKANSSRWVHETFPKRRAFAWQEGTARSASASRTRSVIEYIRNQEHHHRKRDFKEEFLEFLNKYEVEYEERYLWD
jgi:putative transposase